MTFALMVTVAVGVAAWVLAPLRASVRDGAGGPTRNRVPIGRNQPAAPAGDALTLPDSDARDRSVPPGAPGGAG